METELQMDSAARLHDLLRQGDSRALEAFLSSITPAETARAVSQLVEEERRQLIHLLTPEEAADVIWDLPDAHAADILEELSPEDAAAIMEEMESDHRADVLGEIDEEAADLILQKLPAKEAAEARRLMEYPEDSAGGIMVTEFLAYPNSFTVRMVVQDLQTNREEYADYNVQYIYVTTLNRRLVGVLRLRDLLMASADALITSLMISNPLSVNVLATLEDLGNFFDDHEFYGVPVTEDNGLLVGVVESGDVLEAEGERDAESYMRAQGIMSGEELRSMPFRQRSMRRLSWLSLNIVLNVISASIIAIFQDTLSAVIALAVFLPIISDMSGCSGNQAVAVSMRELTLGIATPRDIRRVLQKELMIGLSNGFVLGLLVAVVGYLWKGIPLLGAVAGMALFLNTTVAVCLGGSLPLMMKRIGKDPALASGPILTTITDMCGFFFVLGMASLVLPYLI